MSPPPSATHAIPAEPGESRWFADEVYAHDAQLKAYVRHAFPAVRDVDDVVQESYLRLWKTRAAEPIKCARAFLFTVARRVALNFVARQRSSPVSVVGDLSALPALEERTGVIEHVSRDEKRRLLVEALATLPPRCREITVLRKLRGVSQRDVATQLGISERTVEEQVARGVRRCERFLRQRGITSFHGS